MVSLPSNREITKFPKSKAPPVDVRPSLCLCGSSPNQQGDRMKCEVFAGESRKHKQEQKA